MKSTADLLIFGLVTGANRRGIWVYFWRKSSIQTGESLSITPIHHDFALQMSLSLAHFGPNFGVNHRFKAVNRPWPFPYTLIIRYIHGFLNSFYGLSNSFFFNFGNTYKIFFAPLRGFSAACRRFPKKILEHFADSKLLVARSLCYDLSYG